MNTENLQTLKIHKLTQAQYDRELEAGNIDENALYLTPDERNDLSGYATVEQLNEKSDISHTHEIDDINNLQVSLDELLETSKLYTDNAISTTADINHTHVISDVENLQITLDNKVSASRTINDKPLNSDIVLSATDVGADVSGSANAALENAKTYANNLANGKADISHAHNDIYYTEDEIDSQVHDIMSYVSDIVRGTITVAKSTSSSVSDTAHSATKATQDGDENVITSTYETKSDASAKLAEAKTYADDIKNDLLNGAGGAYDTLKELGDLIDDNTDAIDALEIVASGKADAGHNHDSDYDEKGSASIAVDAHNASASAHSDIRSLINSLDTSLTNHSVDKSNPHEVTLSQLGVTSTAAELNTLDGITATVDELNYVDGVTSNIQIQLDGKADSSHNHSASDITSGTLSSDRLPTVPISNGGTGATTATDALINLGVTATATELNVLDGITATTKELNYMDGVTSKVQTQLSGKMVKSNPAGTGTFSMNRKSDTTVGEYSSTLGYDCTANGMFSSAEGQGTTASGECSHAEGFASTASGMSSHSEGEYTGATGKCSHAEGNHTTALGYQHAQGHYNNTANAKVGVESGTGTGTAFVIGNGTASQASNAFRVDYSGKPYAKSTLTTTGADYAEFFEWKDLNPDSEDRRGYFVTMDGDKIKFAKPNDYILGIISGQPSVVGNGDEDWLGRYVFDEFGAYVYEDFEYEVDEFDKETGEKITVVKTGRKYKENPDYDPTIPYIQREDRPEWDYVGMLGVLSVRDDGTCKVNGCCTVAEGGIATASETGYRVIKRVNDNIVKVVFR